MQTAPGLLIIEESPTPRRAFAALLRKQGYTVAVAESGRDGLRIAAEQPIALTLVNEALPDMAGAEVIRRLRHSSPETEAIVLSTLDTTDAAAAARSLSAGASDYFCRPIRDWARFHAAIDRCLARWGRPPPAGESSETEVAPDSTLRALKGNSAAMGALRSQIACLAPLPDPLLIRGESGTGKELVARAIHALSAVQQGPFVAVNCAALKPELFESELFGHKAGSFTSAARDHAGLVEQAKGGTLFLDEIGELPAELQAKLLRLLEQGEYRRVGCERQRLLDARVLAATHVDLEAAIGRRAFREDLYFRLSALELRVPPLRERREDVQLLVYHFLDHYNRRYQRSIQRITPEALRLLEAADWRRNNVRELEWSIRQAVARTPQGAELTTSAFQGRLTIPAPALIQPLHLLPPPPRIAQTSDEDDPEAAGEGDGAIAVTDLFSLEYSDALREIRRRFAREYASRRLVEANYNKSRAAELSGMKRSNFSRLVRELELDTPDSDE